MKLRAAVLASDALAPAPAAPQSASSSSSFKDKEPGGKGSGDAGGASAAAGGGPTVEAAPFQKVGKRLAACCLGVLWASLFFCLAGAIVLPYIALPLCVFVCVCFV